MLQAFLYVVLVAMWLGSSSRCLWQEHLFPRSSWISALESLNLPWCILLWKPATSVLFYWTIVFSCFHWPSQSAFWFVLLANLSLSLTWNSFLTSGNWSLWMWGSFVWEPFLLGGGLEVKAIFEWTSLLCVQQSVQGITQVCSTSWISIRYTRT